MSEAGTIPLMSDEYKNNITQTIKDYSKRLFGFIKSRVASNEDAEDILQDVFYQLIGNTVPIDQINSWLFTVARNKITDSYRKKRPGSLEDIFINDEDDEFSWDEILFSSPDNPETEYIRGLVWPAIQEALNELPLEQRAAFIMHEMEDMSFEEISEITGVPAATLISRKRYAVLHLRARLEILKNELLNF
jgi:RNA polymerase sigma factor (sigma-70 family)